MNYNIVKARYTKTDENGKTKAVTEQYLVQAVSCTDAEARVVEELSPLYSDLQVKSIGDTKITEVFNPYADRFYLAKVGFITIDERTAVEKRTISQILVGAPDFTNAIEEFNERMRGTLADFEIVSLAETPIKEYFPAKLSYTDSRTN